MPYIPIPPYEPSFTPVPQITPFTYRDGVTMLKKLDNIIRYINKTVIPFINENNAELAAKVEADINHMIDVVNAAISNMEELNDQKIQELTELVNTSVAHVNEIAIQVEAARVEAVQSATSATNSANSASSSATSAANDAVNAEVSRIAAETAAANASNVSNVNIEKAIRISLGTRGTPGANNTALIAQAFTDAAVPVTVNGPRLHSGARGPANRSIIFPAGVWTTTQQVVIPAGVSVVFEEGAVLQAIAPITGALLTTSDVSWQGQKIIGGVLDCNELADHGLFIRTGNYSEINTLRIDDPLIHGAIFGDTSLSASSFEMKINNLTVRCRDDGNPANAGSRGIMVDKCSDSVLFECVAIGFETGFYMNGGDNRKIACHAWGFPNAFPKYGFDDLSGSFSHYIGCVADSPTVAGFRLRVGWAQLTNCSVFLANTQPDNVTYAVLMDAGSRHVGAVNCRFQGANATHRLAADFYSPDATWMIDSSIFNQISAFAVSVVNSNLVPINGIAGLKLERSIFVAGTLAAGDMQSQIFWSVPNQVDNIVIRAGSGTGATFQVWKGGTQVTNTFNLGDVATFESAVGSGLPLKNNAWDGLYIKVISNGTANNLNIVCSAHTV